MTRTTLHILVLVLLVIAAMVGCCRAIDAQEIEPVPASEWQPKEIAVYYPFSSSGEIDLATGRVMPKAPYLSKYSGYERFFMEKLSSHYDDGERLFFLHLPFGRATKRWPMDFDAAVALDELVDQGKLSPASDTNSKNFTFWAGRFLEKHEDASLIVYLGAIGESPRMVAAQDNAAEYLARFSKAIAPITNIQTQFGIERDRIEIVLDRMGSTNATKESPKYASALLLKNLGYRVALEPHWKAVPELEHLNQFPCVATNEHWFRASLKYETRDAVPHATVLLDNSDSADEIMQTIKAKSVDRIAVVPGKIDAVRQAQTEYVAEREAVDK